MSFLSSIIVVEDVIRSRDLYERIMGMKVTEDHGIYNVGFEGGLSLYQKELFQNLTGGLTVINRANSVVLYFEVQDLESVEQTILDSGFDFIHRIQEQPWKQRVFRFYDHDGHVCEVAERMDIVFRRLQGEGKSLEEIAALTGLTIERVKELS